MFLEPLRATRGLSYTLLIAQGTPILPRVDEPCVHE